jgi:hypothetical protein
VKDFFGPGAVCNYRHVDDRFAAVFQSAALTRESALGAKAVARLQADRRPRGKRSATQSRICPQFHDLARGFMRKLMPMRLMAFMAAIVRVRSTKSFSPNAVNAAE